MNSLNAFLNSFIDGFQPNNRFVCKVIVPTKLREVSLTPVEKKASDWMALGILCTSTNLPDRAFAEANMTMYGLNEQFPFFTQYSTLDCTFNTPLDGGNNPVPKVFHAWQNLIQDMSKGYDSSRNFVFSETYYGTIQIGMFDKTNALTLAYQFDRVYPRTVQSTPVTWSEVNEYTHLTVGFTFSTWKSLPTNAQRGDNNFFPDFVTMSAPELTISGGAEQNIIYRDGANA